MATKSYSKHKEYREYSNSGGGTLPPYTDEQFDMIKSDLLPKDSKLNSFGRDSFGRNGTGGGTREYHYEYKEEKLPSGKYDRKDLRTVEEFTIPPKTVPKTSETSSYHYEREERELPAINSGTRTYNYESSISSTPGYSKVKSKATKDLSQNVDELDSLLDDLQRDQERQLYKSGYTSDTAESSSFDYKRGMPVKAPSSGYSTLKREERVETSSWGSSPPPPPPVARTAAEIRREEMYREEKTESRVVPSTVPVPAPQPICNHCHHTTTNSTGTLSRTSTPMNKVTTTVKTYTYEVPADTDPTTVPIPVHSETDATYASENIRSAYTSSRSKSPAPAPASAPGGCQYCSHCNSHVRDVSYRTHVTSTDVTDRSNDRMVYPTPANEIKLVPANEPQNGHGPYGPTTYKYSETTYSSHNTLYPGGPNPPSGPTGSSRPSPSPGPFPRPSTPSPGSQQPPKKLDDLMADFPEARFPTQPDGIVRRKVEVSHERSSSAAQARDAGRDVTPAAAAKPAPPVGSSRNVTGPAVYYPPGHVPFAKKDAPGYEASSAMQAGGGRYAAGRGMYEYEAGSKSKEKHSETKTAVPICLPLCCAMPCVIM